MLTQGQEHRERFCHAISGSRYVQATTLPSPSPQEPLVLLGWRQKEISEVKISLETSAKFQAPFSLILPTLEIGLSSECKFSEITSLALS